MDEWIGVSASSQAKAIRDREVSSEELVTAHLRRIEEVNSQLNAVVQMVSDRALTEAREADRMCARGEMKGALRISGWGGGRHGRRSLLPRGG